jgi:two-component system sensor histidine kinase RegB
MDRSSAYMNQNLHYLFLLRTIAIGGQILALLLMQELFSVELPLLPIAIIITTLFLYTIWSWRYFQGREHISQQIFLIQLLIDVLALSALIYFTGGSVNPFISLFMLPITFAAACLIPMFTWLIVVAAITCYTLLMFFNIPLPNADHAADHHDTNFTLHIWGMWYGFILSAILVAYFVSRIGQSLRERDRALAEARANALHAEQILSLGTLAAGTAHELGTPLATIAILAKELEHEYEDHQELVNDLKLLRQQIDNCKQILSRMADNAGQVQANSGHAIAVDNYLDNLIAEWRQSRPDAQVKTEWQGSLPAPDIIVDQTLTHAIVNILNNAVDHASREVELIGRWDKQKLELEICDDGKGMERALIDKLGENIISTKLPEEGMGLGLFLAKSTLNRFGGTLQLHNRDTGGTRVLIEIPLGSLTI